MEDAPALRQALERLPNDIRLCEEALAVRNRVRLAEGFHARPLIRFLVGLHDEREGSRPQVDARAEALLERPANRAVDAVAAYHQVGVQVRPRIWHLVLKQELHAELASVALKIEKELLALDCGEPDPTEVVGLAPVDHCKAIPAHGMPRQVWVDQPVLLDEEVMGRVGSLGQDGEVETAGTASNADDVHARVRRRPGQTPCGQASWAGR